MLLVEPDEGMSSQPQLLVYLYSKAVEQWNITGQNMVRYDILLIVVFLQYICFYREIT